MGSQPPYGNYPPSQPWPEQPSEPASGDYGQPGAYPPPPMYSAPPYPQYPSQEQAPVPPAPPMYGYGAPNIYVQPAAPYPYVVAAPSDPGSGQAVASLVLGIVGTVLGLLVSWTLCLGFLPLVLGIVGFIMGILGFKSKTRHGMAVAGFVLSIIAVVIPIAFFVLYLVAASTTTFQNAAIPLTHE